MRAEGTHQQMDRLLTALGCCADLSEALLENATLFLSAFPTYVCPEPVLAK